MAKRLSYQVVMATPLLGRWVWHFPGRLHPSLSKAVYDRAAWTDTVWAPYTAQFREPARAAASTQMYRRFLLEEAPAIRKGRYRDSRLTVPTPGPSRGVLTTTVTSEGSSISLVCGA